MPHSETHSRPHNDTRKPIRVPDLTTKKRRGEKITMLTAYDATMARILDDAGIDVLLVGDSVGMAVMGHATTVPVTMDAMLHHTQAVVRGARRALVVADLPFLTYQASLPEAIHNAGRLMQQGGAAAVKLEGGRAVVGTVERLVEIGIPVMGHLGLLPQSVHQLGGFRRQARTDEAAEKLRQDAQALERAGAFAIVLESIPEDLAGTVTEELRVPTIGIGAGPHCDGQVLVSYDAFGLLDHIPPFAKRYAQLGEQMRAAAQVYIEEVKAQRFPALACQAERA